MPMSIGVEFNSTGTENFNIDPLQWKEENLNGLRKLKTWEVKSEKWKV